MKINIKNIAAATLLMMMALPLSATAREKGEKTPFEAPKAGDFSIGIDALPVIKFAGNLFNGDVSNSLSDLAGTSLSYSSSGVSYSPTASLLGRYMLTDKWAVRVNFGLIVDSTYDTEYVSDDEAQYNNSLSEAEVIDTKKSVNSGASIAAGLEYRIGKGRVQGVFSGNALYMYQISSTTYSYGNAVTEINKTPSIASICPSYKSMSPLSSARTLESRGGANHTFGLMATAGIEWFMTNQISLGFEVDLLAAYTRTSQKYAIYEGYNTTTDKVETATDTVSPVSKSFYMATGCFGSNLTINFYF